MGTILTRRLECGATLVVEPMVGVRSCAITWLVPGGSVSEPDDRQGLSAMWEELLLRGAGELDSRAHADALDRLGVTRAVESGTQTMRLSCTAIGDRTLDALPLIVDMVRGPRFEESSIEPARDLALQAIESLKDNPQERAALAARARHLPAPFGRSGLGTVEGLRAITRDDLVNGWRERALPGRSIIGVAGSVDPDALTRRLDDLLAGWEGTTAEAKPGPLPSRGYGHETDATNQVQIFLMHDAPPEPDPSSLLEKVVSSVLSGGMAGRLFTEVREKRGLCYSVSSSYSGSKEFGTVVAYVGTTPERAQESLEVLYAELDRIGRGDGIVTPEEFARAVIGMKSRLIFAGESTGARAQAIALDQHRLGRPRTLEEIAAKIDALTVEELNRYLGGRSMGRITVQTLGPAPLSMPVDGGCDP